MKPETIEEPKPLKGANTQEPDKLAEAQKILAEAETIKRNEFAAKLEGLCAEYGFELKIQSTLIVTKRGV